MSDFVSTTLRSADASLRAGDLDRASALFRAVLTRDPEQPDSLYLLGRIALREGRHEEAVPLLERALAARPNAAVGHAELAAALQNLGRDEEAERAARRAIELDPALLIAHNTLGNALRGLRRPLEAAASFRRALALDSSPVAVHLNLAAALREAGDAEGALHALAGAAELRPDDAELHGAVGNAARALGRLDRAVEAFSRAASVRPDSAAAWCNLSTVSLDLGRLEAAEDRARRAIAIRPELADAHWNLAQALLTRGELQAGWRKYEYRMLKSNAAELILPIWFWDGSPLDEPTLLITAEQGVGDEILFASCLSDVLERVRSCVVECDARLIPLYARSFPGAQWIPRMKTAGDYPASLPRPDFQIAIGSLPRLFRNQLASFPERASFLRPDPVAVEDWRRRYAGLGPGLKVGLSWRGGREALVRRARSIPVSELTWLSGSGNPKLINLQYGDTREELQAAREAGLEIHDWEDADSLRDLDQLAARLAALDLVISVDNATVHMAGAVGTPTWVLLPKVADWRWMLDRDDTPWYSSVTLFRQARAGEWEPVFQRVAAALAEHSRSPAPLPARATETRGPAGRSRPWVALLNDTSYWYHWGCTATSTAIVETLQERGYEVNRVPITGLQALRGGPETLEQFDDVECFNQFMSENAWLFREIEYADHVVINGEGSLHGLSPFVLRLLYVAYAVKRYLGTRVQLINHSCYPPAADLASAAPAARLYRKVYEAADFVAVREPESLARLSAAGIPATEAFDCLPLHVARHFPLGSRRSGKRVVIAGSVAARASDAANYAALTAALAARGFSVTALTGANLFPAADDREFVAALAKAPGARFEHLEADSLELWLDTIASAALLVSGRFHHTIAAAALGTPFVLLESNTPKNAGLARVLGAPPPLSFDAPEAGAELLARAEGALDEKPRESRAERLERLAELARGNFLALPALPTRGSCSEDCSCAC